MVVVVVVVAVVVVRGAVEEAGSGVHARKIIIKMVVIAAFGDVVAASVIGAIWALRMEAAQLMLEKVCLRGCHCHCCSTGAVKFMLGKVF